LAAQYRTLSNIASKGVAEAVATTQAAKEITDSITSDPDIIGLVGGNAALSDPLVGGNAALSDPQIDGLGATASDNLDVYNGGGA
jgi:hypothetical protein